MRGVILTAAMVLVTATAITGTTLMSALPAGAQASCTSSSGYTNDAGISVAVPTIGFQTHNDNCELGLGNDSDAVAVLQWSLDACYGQNLAQDGIYGPLTQEAVVDAQQAAHIPADGIYGPQTRDVMLWDNYGLNGCASL